MQEIETSYKIVIGSVYKKKIVYACEIITYAMQNGAITKAKLQNGFSICGQHVADVDITNSSNSTISFDIIMSQCYTELSQQERDLMKENVPYFLNLLRQFGEITEEEYDSKNIPRLCNSDFDVRNELVLWRQRAVIITNQETVRRYKEYALQVKLKNADPELKKSLSIIEKNNKKEKLQRDKAVNAIWRLEMTEEEKAHAKELSKQQKLAKQIARVNKEIAEQKQLEDARMYVMLHENVINIAHI
jgi:hypothetical protein